MPDAAMQVPDDPATPDDPALAPVPLERLEAQICELAGHLPEPFRPRKWVVEPADWIRRIREHYDHAAA